MVSIVEFHQKDKESVVALIQSLQDHIAVLDPLKLNKHGPAFLATQYVEYLIDRTVRENGIMYIAEEEGRVIGCIGGIVHTVQGDLETYETRDGRIMDLVVSPNYRGKQVGKKLMLAMEEHFKSSHCDFVRVECFGYNKNAHMFYEKCGYHDRSIEMIKKLQ